MKKIIDLGKIGITLGGEYDNNVIYEKLTIVLYKGKSYISTKTVQGLSPEQDIKTWQLVAEAKDAYHMLVDAGKTTLTEEEFLEQLVDATKGRYIVQGNVINAADEEDLTVEHSDILGIDTLKLANRPSTNGMGYVILRKNKTFAEQVIKENTIYEIRYDFTLNENITIPTNCVLKFNGGSISSNSNFLITLNNTIIDAQNIRIFKNVLFNGTVGNTFNAVWSCDNTGTEDVIKYINNIIEIASYKKVILHSGIYNISSPILFKNSTWLEGEVKTSQNVGTKINWIGGTYTNELPTDNSKDMLSAKNYSSASGFRIDGCVIKNLYFECNAKAKNGLNLSGFANSVVDNVFIRQPKHAAIYAHSSLYGSFTTPMIATTIYNSSCWSASTKVNEKLVFETKYGVRLCSQCNGNRFINWTSSKCETGFSIEDSVKADDTFDKSINWGCNQNVFVGCEAEPTKYAIYMNSSNNQFIGCRAENNDYVIFYPEEDSNRSNYIGYNAYIGINVYSNYIAFTNVDTVRDIIINAGPSENFLKSPKANIKEVDTFILNNSADNTINFKPDVFQHSHPSGHLLNKVMVNNGKAYKSQGYDGTKFTDIDIYYFDTRSKEVCVPIKLAEIQRNDIREWNAYYDRGYLININNRPHYIDKQVISPILLGKSGTNRPTFTDNDKGNIFFDTTLNKPIWWNGTAWVDATGTPV